MAWTYSIHGMYAKNEVWRLTPLEEEEGQSLDGLTISQMIYTLCPYRIVFL